MHRAAVAVPLAALAFAANATAATAPSLAVRGYGPLKLGMSRDAAVKTGWLAHKGKGCELASPRPTTYRVDGPKAPAGIVGTAEFTNGKLRSLSFNKGVHTATGVKIGTTVTRMVARYKKLGYDVRAKYQPTFQATFVDVHRFGDQVLTGVATGGIVRSLSIPDAPVCE